MLSIFLKKLMVDKNLLSVRKKISEYIPENAKVIDIGCGNGSLLFLLADKIKKGVGIDTNSKLIKYANKKALRKNIENLDFKVMNVNQISERENYDFATSTLTIHTMNQELRKNALRKMSLLAPNIILADYSLINLKLSKLLIHFDEILAGHYKKFIDYNKREGLGEIIKKSNLTIKEKIESPINEIDIYLCKRK